VVDDPKALAPAYERLFGIGAVSASRGALQVNFARSRLSFLTPLAFAERHPGAALPDVPPPFLAALTIGVARLSDTAQYFDDFGVPGTTGPDGVIRIAPAAANGTLVAFEAA